MASPNGTLYSGSVTNERGGKGSFRSAQLDADRRPDRATIASANATTFTVTQPDPSPLSAPAIPRDAFMTGRLAERPHVHGGDRSLAGTPPLGTVGNYPLTVSATTRRAGEPGVSRYGRQGPTVRFTFAGPSIQAFSATPITLSATASSGLGVSFTSSTLGVCTVSGTSAHDGDRGTLHRRREPVGQRQLQRGAAGIAQLHHRHRAAERATITSLVSFSGSALVYFSAPASMAAAPSPGTR